MPELYMPTKTMVDAGVANLAISGVYNTPQIDLGPEWAQYATVTLLLVLDAGSTGTTVRLIGVDEDGTSWGYLANAAASGGGAALTGISGGYACLTARVSSRYVYAVITNGATAAFGANARCKIFAQVGVL